MHARNFDLLNHASMMLSTFCFRSQEGLTCGLAVQSQNFVYFKPSSPVIFTSSGHDEAHIKFQPYRSHPIQRLPSHSSIVLVRDGMARKRICLFC